VRIARVAVPGLEHPVFGVIDGERIDLIVGSPFVDDALNYSGVVLNLHDVRLLAPVLPSKIVCVGKNYADHAAEMGGDVPVEPVIFLKPNTSVIGDGDSIVLPTQSSNVHYEAELAVIIGAVAKNVDPARADEVIFGYTCANDVTARDLQNSDGQWTRAKSFDTFCPLGPWIETELEPTNLAISTELNGDTKQDGNTKDLVRTAREMVAWISQVMTLVPGDVVLTGTPAGVGPMVNGDVVSVTIEEIGTLTNPVVSR